MDLGDLPDTAIIADNRNIPGKTNSEGFQIFRRNRQTVRFCVCRQIRECVVGVLRILPLQTYRLLSLSFLYSSVFTHSNLCLNLELVKYSSSSAANTNSEYGGGGPKVGAKSGRMDRANRK